MGNLIQKPDGQQQVANTDEDEKERIRRLRLERLAKSSATSPTKEQSAKAEVDPVEEAKKAQELARK